MRKTATMQERVERSIVIDPDGCWRWQLRVDKTGYGRITLRLTGLGTVNKMAHRIAYEAWKGEIPAGLDLDHLCRVRDCVNPDHLEPVTRSENLRRSPLVGLTSGRHNAIKTHCPQGHEYTPENTYQRGRQGRNCRQCQRDRSRIYMARRRSESAA